TRNCPAQPRPIPRAVRRERRRAGYVLLGLCQGFLGRASVTGIGYTRSICCEELDSQLDVHSDRATCKRHGWCWHPGTGKARYQPSASRQTVPLLLIPARGLNARKALWPIVDRTRQPVCTWASLPNCL